MGYLYVAGALVGWAAMAFTYRRAESLHGNRFCTTMSLGLGSVACNLVVALVSHVDVSQGHASQYLIGGVTGLLNVVGLPLFLAAVARGDLSVTWLTATLAFALASALSLIYPHVDDPTALGIAGLAVAAAAMVLLGLDVYSRMQGHGAGRGGFKKGWFFFMSIAFVINGLSIYSFTPASYLAPPSDVNRLAFMIAFAGAIALGGLPLVLFAKSDGALRPGLIWGFLTGVGSFTGGYLTLLAIQQAGIPSYVVYPASNGGSNVLVVALSVMFLRERPGRWGWSGMTAGVLALVLLGMAAKPGEKAKPERTPAALIEDRTVR